MECRWLDRQKAADASDVTKWAEDEGEVECSAQHDPELGKLSAELRDGWGATCWIKGVKVRRVCELVGKGMREYAVVISDKCDGHPP